MPPRGRPFKKGQVTNPGGRPPLPPEVLAQIKTIKSINKPIIELMLNRYCTMSVNHLEQLQGDKSIPAMDQMIIRVILHTINNGDVTRLTFLLDRLIGKVPDQVISTNIGIDVNTQRVVKEFERIIHARVSERGSVTIHRAE